MRQDRALITLEGRIVISRALAHPGWRVTRLLVTPTAQAALRDALDAMPTNRRPALEVLSAEELTAAGGFQFHQGCLAYAERPEPVPWRQLDLEGSFTARDRTAHRRTVIVLDDVRDPDNVGSIFRSALAFGVRAVLLGPGCADPLYRKAIRTSMAATLSLPFAKLEPWPDALDDLRARGFTLVAATPDAGTRELDAASERIRQSAAIALLVGSEGAGLSAAALARADECVRIPVGSAVDSLNVAVATAILLYELR